MPKKEVVKVTLGGWFQRTTLHLSEVYEFFENCNTKLELDRKKLKELHNALDLTSVKREQGYFEYVKAVTKDGIIIKYYEDGLYILEYESDDIIASKEYLDHFFENKLNPAINFIFSLGAPTPKILANINQKHPIVVSVIDRQHSKYEIDKNYGDVYSKITSKNITVYKTPPFIFVVASPTQKDNLTSLVEMQIFFREFKDQLQRYLDIHRKIWEEISDIKEKEYIQGRDVSEHRARLDSYRKSITLIRDRINQMDPYAKTRSSISKYLRLDETLSVLFRYKYEDLFSTLSYIKEIWRMTSEYVDSAISMIKEVETQAISSSIKSIQILASVGVVAGILGYLTRESLPSVSSSGAFYFGGLIVLAVLINYAIKLYYKNKKYKLKFIEHAKNI
ncbi:MAG: hypothetical protein ABIE22_03080 [archaeon]